MTDERDDREPKVKALLDDKAALAEVVDEATRRELERWFALPSFEQVAEEKQPTMDPGVAEVRARRDKAMAEVDPAFLASIDRRNAARAAALAERAPPSLVADRRATLVDLRMFERDAPAAEPYEMQLPQGIDDDLKECTPQALLRDLHRPETEFAKQLEVVDHMAQLRLDAVHEAHVAMTTRWHVAPDERPFAIGRAALLAGRAEHRLPWTRVLAMTLPNRRVTE